MRLNETLPIFERTLETSFASSVVVRLAINCCRMQVSTAIFQVRLGLKSATRFSKKQAGVPLLPSVVPPHLKSKHMSYTISSNIVR